MRRRLFVLGFIAVFFGSVRAAGSEVQIRLMNGNEITGELLAVRGKVLVLSGKIGLTEEKLKQNMSSISSYRTEEIQTITVKGKSYLWDGVSFGFLAGICVGVLVAFDPSGGGRPIPFGGGEDPLGPGASAILYTTLGGVAIGAFLGTIQSTKDRATIVMNVSTLMYFEKAARYHSDIPEFLQPLLKSPER